MEGQCQDECRTTHEVRPMKTKDSDFFGLWNKQKQIWENQGILDYDRYSNELAQVLDAVKADDYKLAKNLLLEYYREKSKEFNLALTCFLL